MHEKSGYSVTYYNLCKRHTKLRGLFNSKDVLIEIQYLYDITHS